MIFPEEIRTNHGGIVYKWPKTVANSHSIMPISEPTSTPGVWIIHAVKPLDRKSDQATDDGAIPTADKGDD